MMKDKERMRKYNSLEEIKKKQLKAMGAQGLYPGKEKIQWVKTGKVRTIV